MDKSEIEALNRNSERMREQHKNLRESKLRKLANVAGLGMVENHENGKRFYYTKPETELEKMQFESHDLLYASQHSYKNWNPSINPEHNYLCEKNLTIKGQYRDMNTRTFFADSNSIHQVVVEFADSSDGKKVPING